MSKADPIKPEWWAGECREAPHPGGREVRWHLLSRSGWAGATTLCGSRLTVYLTWTGKGIPSRQIGQLCGGCADAVDALVAERLAAPGPG